MTDQPTEHCGHLSPETLLTTPRTECVLRPGHSGSHANVHGTRWLKLAEPNAAGTVLEATGPQPTTASEADQPADEEYCGSEPPGDGTWGDCWCTLPPGHDGQHKCEPCAERHGAPGWNTDTAEEPTP